MQRVENGLIKLNDTLRDRTDKLRALRAKLLENGAFNEYLRLLVYEIRVKEQEVDLTGSCGAVAQAVAANLGDSHGVPRFAP